MSTEKGSKNPARKQPVPTKEKAKPAPLTLADVTISRARYSRANQPEEIQSFSGAQIALLLIANEYEGNLTNITDRGCIAEEIRGVCQCLEALSVCQTRSMTDDAEHECAGIDFLERSLRRIADRVDATRERLIDPGRYLVEILAHPATDSVKAA